YPDNGTDWFLLNNTSGIEIFHQDQRGFFLSGFDATEYSWSHPGGSAIEVRGITMDQQVLSHSFITPERAQYQAPQFTTFSMPQEWVDVPLQYVTITAPSRGFAVDNIQVPFDPNSLVEQSADRIFLARLGPNEVRSMPLN